MIKLIRGECPKELTKEVRKELTELYMQNKDRDVWNFPKIKKPVKMALMEMSHNKCAYCECMLGIESKDVTIDHFQPKSITPQMVITWENLFPSCLRCNRKKCDSQDIIVNPCQDEPKDYIAICNKSRYRLKGIDTENKGANTIRAIGLNDCERVMVPRMIEWEAIHQRLEEVYNDLNEDGYKEKYKNRFELLLEKCTEDNSYAAVKATNMLDDEYYLEVKAILIENRVWTQKFVEIENSLKKIALTIV